jgi:hypothetical protein
MELAVDNCVSRQEMLRLVGEREALHLLVSPRVGRCEFSARLLQYALSVLDTTSRPLRVWRSAKLARHPSRSAGADKDLRRGRSLSPGNLTVVDFRSRHFAREIVLEPAVGLATPAGARGRLRLQSDDI